MQWSKEYIYVKQFAYVSTNQYGDRFKRIGNKRVSVAVLKADINNAGNLQTLILLSHHLDVPVHYDFESDPQVAFIKIVGAEECL